MNKTDLKLYAITDRQWLHGARLSEHVKLAIEGGATMIQIRDKDILSTDSDAGLKDEYNEALEIKRICHEHKVPLIINDNVQFAIDIDADGVHLGQDDMNPAEARKLLGTDKIIGVTAKTVEQAKRAEADGADYLGSGAVFGSTTKLNAKPMTKELLREITAAVDIPVVAIGGINADNAVTLKDTGIAGIAVVGAIFASADIKAAAKKYPYMDVDRVGIYGCSAGGQESTAAVLQYPEFYKAAYSACGCHDNRMDKIWWNEQWMGYPVDSSYIACSNVEMAHKLSVPLMLVVGEMDDNVDPASTMQVVNALIKANKDFDLLVIPGARHTMGDAYGEHKRYDFFVEHLMKKFPPQWSEFEDKDAQAKK